MTTRLPAVLMLVSLALACTQPVEPAPLAAVLEQGVSSEPPMEVTLGAEPRISLLSPLGYLGSEAQCFLDGELQETRGGELRLAATGAARHVLRVQVPGFHTREIVIVIDPQSPERTLQVSLEAVQTTTQAGEPEEPARGVFVYDLY